MKGLAIQLISSDTQEQVLRPVFDIVRDQSGRIVNGLNVGATQPQNEALILASNAGEFKNSPTLGVGLSNAVLSDTADTLKYRHAVRRNYDLEGLSISQLDMFDLRKINIVAKYR